MNRIFVVVPILSGLLFVLPASAEYAPGEILLKFKPAITRSITAGATVKEMLEVSISKVSQLSVRCRVDIPQVKNVLKEIGVLHLKFSPDSDVLKIIEKYRADPEVEYAEPNYVRHIFITVPNDTRYGQQWGLLKMWADYAWDVTKGDTSVIVAVLDTGVDTDHGDLKDKLCPGYDCVSEDSDPNDDYGHGTHVAGIVGAITNNNTGVAGVSWYCRIMPVKIMGADGSGYSTDLIQGINYAAANGAKVINMSLGGEGSSSPEQTTINNAHSAGCVIVASAGNSGTYQVIYPAAYDNVIAVGATDSNDQRASFSEMGSWLDVCAPGVNIWSTMPNHTVTMNGSPYNADKDYDSLQGTSMAAPFVSGVAALIFARHSPISNADVELRLKRGVDDLGSTGKDDLYGYGRINAALAIGDFLSEIDPIKIYVYPNPLRFPEKTTVVIKNIPLKSSLTVKIYNIAGELVRQFSTDDIKLNFNPDYASIEWDGKNDYNEGVVSGVYIAVVSDGTRVATEKIMVIK